MIELKSESRRDSVIVSVVLHASLQHSAWKVCVLCAFTCSQVVPKLVSETLNGAKAGAPFQFSSQVKFCFGLCPCYCDRTGLN